ncbi:MAG: adenylosuccinate lyase [candidate division Zixibacteria bacterium HGW-Zixibacteria-1]|nr:MAG: adenylosuccinate lyase [candidate division Zixibacteria bacterium HGW-Zixibacteria-1]
MIARYTLPEMGALWSDEAKYRHWLMVEIAVCRAMAEMGMIPQKALKNIIKKADFNIDRINEVEAVTNHDVIAFLTSVSEFVGPDAKYIHYGMTSSDMLDTALSLQMKLAALLIDKKLVTALAKIKKLAMKYKMTPIIGRTHGVAAEPTTLGLKFSVWYTELERGRERFKVAAENAAVGAISGAVGNFANIDPRIEARVCKLLGLQVDKVSTQVIQRDRHAEYITAMAILMSSVEKFGTEIRNLHRTEIGEIQEGFAKGQKGSSAMPHKKNPITSERLSGIARLIRGYSITAMENVPLWHERDIAHSSAERVIIPDSTILTDYGLKLLNDILDRLAINPKRMMENINIYGGIVFSQRLLLKLTDALGDRDKAYRMVQRAAMEAYQGGPGFKELVMKDKDITSILSAKEIEESFELDYYFKNVDKIFKRVFGK